MSEPVPDADSNDIDPQPTLKPPDGTIVTEYTVVESQQASCSPSDEPQPDKLIHQDQCEQVASDITGQDTEEKTSNLEVSGELAATEAKTTTIAGTEYRVLDGAGALQALTEGLVLENCHIETLDFSQAPGTYRHRLIIKNSVIGTINFAGAIFHEPVYLEKVICQNDLEISFNATFHQDLIFQYCIFPKNLQIKNIQIAKDLRLGSCVLHGSCQLEHIKVGGELSLGQSNFQRKLMIRDCRSQGNLRLLHTEMHGETNIESCQFAGIAAAHFRVVSGHTRFANCRITSPCNFDDTQTNVRLDFEKMVFDDLFKCNSSVFSNKLVFKACQFHKHACWCNCEFHDHLAFPDSCFSDVAFDGSVFHDQVFFQNSTMVNASFRGNRFCEAVNFQSLKVDADFLCQGSEFLKSVDFSFVESGGRGRFSFNSDFHGNVEFYRALLRGSVWFLGSRFQDVSFANTTFEGQVFFNFDRATLRERNRRRKGRRELSLGFVSVFNGKANFTNALFYRKAVFENVFFKEFANFENAYFAEEINFENAHFQKGASFKASFCTQELNFTKTVFDDYVNFDLANINRRLNLTDATIDRGISFYHAVIDVVVVEREQIARRLIYEGMVPNQEYKKHFMRVKEEYLILKESFHQRGKFDEEDWGYYRYRLNDRKSITQKAWRSLFGRKILAVQDEVPEEELEDSRALMQEGKKALQKAQKALAQSQKRLTKHQADLEQIEHEKPRQAMLEKIGKLSQKISEQEISVADREKSLASTTTLIEMNDERQHKLHESKDKPFNRLLAMLQLLRNAFWVLVDWGTGYGMHPFRIGFFALAVILLFALVYHASGVPYPGNDPNLVSKTSGELGRYLDWVYFSAMSFATSSPEGDIAYNPRIKFFIMVEALSGLFLMALFVGCYTRKIIR